MAIQKDYREDTIKFYGRMIFLVGILAIAGTGLTLVIAAGKLEERERQIAILETKKTAVVTDWWDLKNDPKTPENLKVVAVATRRVEPPHDPGGVMQEEKVFLLRGYEDPNPLYLVSGKLPSLDPEHLIGSTCRKQLNLCE